MRTRMIVVALFIAIDAVGQSADDLRTFNAAAEVVAAACVLGEGSCDTVLRGRLEPGDCTVDGRYVDYYRLVLPVGTIIEVSLRPLSATFTQPAVVLVTPPGDASKTPATIGGAAAATIRYVTSSTGEWRIGVGTFDLFGFGDYAVEITCSPDDEPGQPQNCILQWMMCAQSGVWELTNQHCRFTTEPTRLFAQYLIWGAEGDTISVHIQSSTFRPVVGLYDQNGLISAITHALVTNSEHEIRYTFPRTDEYRIVATSAENARVGPFTMSIGCGRSGCAWPIILQQPQNVSVEFGRSATFSVSANGTSPLNYGWSVIPDLSVVGAGSSFTTPPLTRTQSFAARAFNPCGQADSNVVTATVGPGRKRPVRR